METEDLISSFKSANQSLRKRAIALGILMILAVALSYSENERFNKVSDLIEYQNKLEQLSKLPDSSFQKMIDEGWRFSEHDSSLYHENNDMKRHSRLFEQVKHSNYSRELVYATMEEIDQKINAYNEKLSIGIVGLSIPLEPVAYLSLIFVLIVFHDFTQMIIVRNQIYRRIRGQKIPQWKLGFEFFGFYTTVRNTSFTYLRFTSSLITCALIICPLLTSYLMTDLNNSNSFFLLLLNILCFALIVIDTTIIFSTENIAGFRYFSNRYLGKHTTSKRKLRLMWGIPLLVVFTVNLGLGCILTKMFVLPGIMYFLMSLLPPVLLYYSLVVTQKKPTKRNRAFRAGALLLQVCWVVSTGYTLCSSALFSAISLNELGVIYIAVIVFCALYSLVYMRFFMVKSRWDRNPKRSV